MNKKIIMIIASFIILCSFVVLATQISEAGHYNSQKGVYFYDDEENYAFLAYYSGQIQRIYVDISSCTDGKYGWVACVASPSSGRMKYRGYVHIAPDVTERERWRYGISRYSSFCETFSPIIDEDVQPIALMISTYFQRKH